MTAIEFEDPLGRVVEEVAVVRHRDDRPGKAREKLFEPLHALGVEMIGRFVEQQHVGFREQQAAQRDAALLAARERLDLRIPGRKAQRVGSDFELLLDVVAAFGEEHRFEARLLFGERFEIGVGLRVRCEDLVETLPRRDEMRESLFDRFAHRLAASSTGSCSR